MTVTTVDPATGERLADHPHTTPAEVEAILARPHVPRPPGERAALLRALAARLRAGAGTFASLVTAEMGKPLGQARAEIAKCALVCEHYAGRLPALLAPRRVELGGESGYVRPLPLGRILAIMPWNYPFWQVFRAAVPAVAIGDAVVLKHADNVTGAALAVADLFADVFGPGTLDAVVVPPDRVGALIDDPRVAAVAFTGGDRVGAIVAARAGAAVKKTVLELGGSDPFLVLADADVPAAARAAVRSRFHNTGQSCIAAKRILVHRAVRAEFLDAAVAEVEALTVGDPTAPGTDIGPMARLDLRDGLRRQLDATLAEGARLLAGGGRDDRPGAWFPPTLVEVASADTTAFREETFGPFGAVLAVADEEEALAVANASRYGLSCSIWTRDTERAAALAGRVAAGSVFVNRVSESDPRLPVGGVKASGHGRELGDAGALEFANLQSVRIA
ncbi:aldehyde dehydrogenase family protein [Actinomadura kijaniata]|uniref:aldehyde dehydrogenase family protein n=1 Tax=Actinomadura kijaniata TaxID=46161 RepID=UPI00082F68D7|nr:aldehyde dehydrogenase family protein [Actinomadura kijaniata]